MSLVIQHWVGLSGWWLRGGGGCCLTCPFVWTLDT